MNLKDELPDVTLRRTHWGVQSTARLEIIYTQNDRWFEKSKIAVFITGPVSGYCRKNLRSITSSDVQEQTGRAIADRMLLREIGRCPAV